MSRNELKRVGFWCGEHSLLLPDPSACVDPFWEPAERHLVIEHLRAGRESARYRGISFCRLCGRANGNGDLTDGTYVWPDGLVHYVDAHHVRLPDDFVAHVLKTRGE